LKLCPDCGEWKEYEDFPRNKNTASGRATYCKPCHNERAREQRERVGGSRYYHLKRRYKLTPEAFNSLMQSQAGLCAICSARPAKHIDHDHRTGKVRGLLCFGCNGGLGQFRDNAELLRSAIAYLQKAESETSS